MELMVVPPGDVLDTEIIEQVHSLFQTFYFRYHYMDDLGSADRLRVVAMHAYLVVAYAAAHTEGGVTYLANMLVRREWQGKGVGRQIEIARYEAARSQRMPVYVSTTCDAEASQRLKLSLGLRPTAIKIGYRRDVLQPGFRGSSIVFTDAADVRPQPISVRGSVANNRLGRRRYLGMAAPDILDQLAQPADEYVDMLVSPDCATKLGSDPRFRYAGIDIDRATGTWHHCFQVCNSAYYEGARAGSAVVTLPERVDPLCDWADV